MLHSFVSRDNSLHRLGFFCRIVIMSFLFSLLGFLFVNHKIDDYSLIILSYILLYPMFCLIEQRIRSIGWDEKNTILWFLSLPLPLVGVITIWILILKSPKTIEIKDSEKPLNLEP